MKLAAIKLAALSIMLASCQTTPDTSPVASNPSPYKALGTEPFWSLVIDGKNMRFNHEKEVFASGVEARPSFNGWRYVSPQMTADVTFSECSDGMSDFIYKDSVSVMVGDKLYKGCGGGIIAPTQLDGTIWQFKSINAVVIAPEREASLRFDGNRMSGSVGCNRLGADYTFENKALMVGPVMSTRMACPDPIGAQENAFISLLGTPFTTTFPGDGTVVLTGANGSSVVLMQQM